MSHSVRRPRPVAVRAPSRLRVGRNPVAPQGQHTKSPSPPPTSAGDLSARYEAGRRYARLARSAGARKGQAVTAAARALGLPHQPFRQATQYAAAVDRIVANGVPAAKRLLLSGHPRLPPKVVLKIARTHPDRQRFALAQARAGRDPLGPPPAGVEPPFDTLGPGEVLNRLGRNTGALDKVADGLRDVPPSRRPEAEALAVILAHAVTIARHARLMKRVARDSKARTPGEQTTQHPGGRKTDHARKPFDPRFARRDVAAAAGVTAKNVRDLPRALTDTPPTEEQ